MQFKHPELLYALFLLLIPIIVHLFQLRRFRKEQFTNVAFLKEVVIKTRKSSQIKKWLTLLSRLLALAFLVLAFAQPYYSNRDVDQQEEQLVVYVDNSFSMQAAGPKGPLLSHSMQELYTKLESSSEFDWFTNDKEFANSSIEDFKREILQLEPSQTQLPLEQVMLKAGALASAKNEQNLRLVLISDFQRNLDVEALEQPNFNVDAVYLEPVNRNNISLDSAYVSTSGSQKRLHVLASADRNQDNSYPVSLLNNNQLVTKSSFDFSNNNQSELIFELENNLAYDGQISLNDEQLSFDNSLYFSIDKPAIIKVLSVSEEEDEYLKRLFSGTEFNLTAYRLENLNYSQILDQNLLILNGLREISPALLGAIEPFIENGGHLVLVPGQNCDISSYNSLMSNLGIGRWGALNTEARKVSTIAFEHPLYRDVFDKKVSNFEYPTIESFYDINSTASPALQLDGGNLFLIQQDGITVFTASLDLRNGNFISSPLIVPTFYNSALNSLPSPPLYYTIGQENEFAIPAKIEPDQVLRLRDQEEFIPLQQRFTNYVRVQTNEQPAKAATYAVMSKLDTLSRISYNYNRQENSDSYLSKEQLTGINVYDSIDSLLLKLREDNSVTTYWKWFLIFAVLFLVVEMALLKFLK